MSYNIICSYKNRKIDYSQPVYIYRNLHNNVHKYSIRQGDLVVGHTSNIMLGNVQFIVRELGRRKVIKEERKNVHAFIKGFIIESGYGTTAAGKLPAKITYNPYIDKQFKCENLTTKPFYVRAAGAVIINKHGVTAAYITEF